jgi:hypothetical protein
MEGPKYSKIETLFNRGEDFTVRASAQDFRRPEFAMVDKWLVTEKLDGTHVRVRWDGGLNGGPDKVIFGGRTERAQLPTDLLAYLQNTFTIGLLRGRLGDGAYTLFGEGVGGRIQKAGPHYGELAFVLFDVRLDSGLWLDLDNVYDIANSLGVLSVPTINSHMPIANAVQLVRAGFVTAYPAKDATLPAEGIVARLFPTLLDRRGRQLMWKLKTKDFQPGRKR